MYNDFLTTKEVSSILQISIAYVKKLIREFKLGAYKMEKEYKISDSDLEEYLASVRYGKQE